MLDTLRTARTERRAAEAERDTVLPEMPPEVEMPPDAMDAMRRAGEALDGPPESRCLVCERFIAALLAERDRLRRFDAPVTGQPVR
ncbi:MAG: hypothetical protein WC273_00810 [Dehalococcoidia bacterium]